MNCMEGQRGNIRYSRNGESVTLENLSGSLSVSLDSGTLILQPRTCSWTRRLAGRISVTADRRNYASSGDWATDCVLESLPKPFDSGVAVHCSQSLSSGDSSLHWRICAADGFFVLWSGISGLEEPIRRLVSFQSDDFLDSLGPARMLCLSYCGAHTGSSLSQSRISSLAADNFADSWWASAFVPSTGPSLVMGYLSALRFAGKIEAAGGKVRAFNFGEGVTASSGSVLWSEPLYLAVDANPAKALEAYASMAAAYIGSRIRHSPVFGWGSWFQYHDSITEEVILRNAIHLRHNVPQASHRAVIQVDHGWEERIALHRPETSWEAREEFSSDLQGMMTRIGQSGLRNGLWVVPFAVNEGSRYLGAHMEYLVRDESGRPRRVGGKGKGYCIDPTHPGGERWLRNLFSRLTRMGIEYFKLDYLRVLLSPDPSDPVDDLDSKRAYWNGATRVEAYRWGLGVIRDTVGDSVYLLASGAPALPGAGLVDGHRVGQDISDSWHDGRTGIVDCTRNIACNLFWHNRLWRNDPDYLVLPKEGNLRRFWATAIALSGGSCMVSADFSKLDSDRLHTLRAVAPPLGESATVAEWEKGDLPGQWRLSITAHGETYCLVGMFNKEDSPVSFLLDARELEWPEVSRRFIGWDFWGERSIGESEGPFTVTVPGRDVVLACIRAVRTHPMLVGTSLHYSMGAMELAFLEWSPDTLSLAFGLSGNVPKEGVLYFRVPPSYVPGTSNAVRFEMKDGMLAVPLDDGDPRTIRLKFRRIEESIG